MAPDNIGGARRAAEHLIELGHRRIAFLGGRAGMVVQEDRRTGWERALEAVGLPADPALIVETTPNREGGMTALAQALAVPDPPTAALCFNDMVAIGVLYGLAERGLAAGRDFAVIGFDDIVDAEPDPAAAHHGRGRQPQSGRARGRILIDLLRADRNGPQHFTGETQLDRARVVRGASAHIRGAA